MEGDRADVWITIDGEETRVEFIYYRGNWYVEDIEFAKPIKKIPDNKPSELEGDEDIIGYISHGVTLSTLPEVAYESDNEKIAWGLGYNISSSGEYAGINLSATYQSIIPNTFFNTSPRYPNGFVFDLGCSLEHSIITENIIVTPYLEASAGVAIIMGSEFYDTNDLSSTIKWFYYRVGIGTRFIAKDSKNGLGLGVSYQLNTLSTSISYIRVLHYNTR